MIVSAKAVVFGMSVSDSIRERQERERDRQKERQRVSMAKEEEMFYGLYLTQDIFWDLITDEVKTKFECHNSKVCFCGIPSR